MTTKELTRPAKTATTTAAAPPAPRRLSPFDMLQTEIDRVFDAFSNLPGSFGDRGFLPNLEVKETDSTIEVEAELPGIDEKDVEISLTDGLLTIRGEKKFEKDEKKKNYRLVERSYGSFERQVALPPGVDASKVKATMEKGVLSVQVPKPAAAKAQQIKISAQPA